MAKYNRFIKCKNLNPVTSDLQDIIINIDSIELIYPENIVGAQYEEYDAVFLKNRPVPFYILSDSGLFEVLKRLGDQIHEI